ncbi:protein GAMETE EXPRESSED 1 isoform X2 [Ziziphus jujuba]|uniref:Protein GAMETE EXPRESSED 1 isoform X2 n=1 Tax=Ziziphus jujuba TaxID=326968 RepID=A0ABM3IGJ2_ZIZJJ|nr:protein GAMETE EXPRESSED 1 isoform X2 [Ziziphus jujuba]
MGHQRYLILVLISLFLSKSCLSSWFPFSFGKTQYSQHHPYETLEITCGSAAEFSINSLNDEKGIERINNAKRKLIGSKSCWHDAYQLIFAACSEIVNDDNEKRKRFAWDLSNCFQKDTGRPLFPSCYASSPMKECLKKLDNDALHTYRQFFLETNSICHQLQSDIFKRQTERLVDDLTKSADYAEEKLESIEEKSGHLLQGTKDIHESLASIDQQTHQLSETSKNVSDYICDILKQSEAVFEKSEKISASQTELQKGQEKMKEKIEKGMVMLHESYHNMSNEIGNLQDETTRIEKKITIVGDTLCAKMSKTQDKADDIGNVSEILLEREKQLLQGQSAALEGLQSLNEFQSQALEESRGVLQRLTQFGHEQQEELLRRQELLRRANDHLVQNSKLLLAAQEGFEQKQASMFVALEKLFALHNALLLESRVMKAIFIHSIATFILYIFTSTKQTYTVRHKLYMVLRFTNNNIELQSWLINIVRSLSALIAAIKLLHAILTYKDYEMLNYIMLKKLTEEVANIHKIALLSWETDSEEDWSTWIDCDVSDGIDNLKDSDHGNLGGEEEVGENFNPASLIHRYNLRSQAS